MMKTIAEGLIIGVFAGLILSLFNIVYQRYIEHEQVKYINRTLSDSYIDMCNMDEKTRIFHLNGTLEILKLVLQSRSQNISYNRHYELIMEITVATENLKLYEYGYNLTMYDVEYMLFKRIRDNPRLSWLKLPDNC